MRDKQLITCIGICSRDVCIIIQVLGKWPFITLVLEMRNKQLITDRESCSRDVCISLQVLGEWLFITLALECEKNS